MKRLLFVPLLIFFIGCQSAKTPVLSDFIPEDCTNAVLFFEDFMFSSKRSEPENFVNYYLDDVEEIRNIFSTWTDLKKIPVFPRHIDSGFLGQFNVYLMVEGKKSPCPVNKFSTDGKLITINGTGYEYNSEYWEMLRPKLKLAKREVRTYENAREFRNALEEIQNDGSYVYSESRFKNLPAKYDGYFYITADTRSFSKVSKSIAKKYPDIDFEIGEQLDGGLFSPSGYRIYSSREFYETFDLYPKKEYTEFTDIDLILYLK